MENRHHQAAKSINQASCCKERKEASEHEKRSYVYVTQTHKVENLNDE